MTNKLKVNFDITKIDWGKLGGYGLYFYLSNDIWKNYGNADAELTILLTDSREMCALNKKWRNKDIETNILAFPNFKEQFSNKLHYIGDIALGYEIVFQEAKARDVPLLNHAAHLVIHGVLHLVGYSHESVEDEFKMQKIETKVLKEVGIPNPYAY